MNSSRINLTSQQNPAPAASSPAPRRGLNMVECCIALAICSSLLTAVAVAFQTSFDAVEINDEFTRATQAARVSMNQMLQEVRRASSVQVSADGTQLDVIRVPSTRAPNEVYRRYEYDPTNKKLTFQIFYAAGVKGPQHTLCKKVELAKFGPAETAPASTVVVRVPVLMSVHTKKTQAVVLEGTAAPRQAMKY